MTEKQFLNQIREERLTNLLSSEINEAEPLWLDYEYEETQVKLDIADMILQELCFDTIKQTNYLESRFAPEKTNIDEVIDKIFEDSKEEPEAPIILQKDNSASKGPIKPTSENIKI